MKNKNKIKKKLFAQIENIAQPETDFLNSKEKDHFT